jgi:hypothetical protein
MKTEQDIIKGSVWHVLNFLTLTVMEYAFTLAFERELVDLKGLVKPGSISDSEDGDAGLCVLQTELDLLEALDEPPIRILLETICKLLDCANVYRIVIGLDVEELVTEDRYNNMAGDTWGSMYYEVHGNSYEELLEDGACMYVALGYVIYTCACQLNYQKEDVYDQADEEYCDRMMDVLDGLVKMEDSKAQMLIDLIADIQQEALKISDCGNDG